MATDLARLPATCAGCGSKVELCTEDQPWCWVERGSELRHQCSQVDTNAYSLYDALGWNEKAGASHQRPPAMPDPYTRETET